MKKLAHEWDVFLTAVMFFTRVRVPSRIGHGAAMLNEASRYFPLVGLMVAGWGAVVTVAALGLWPATVAVMVGMLATLWMTGAFHEDGLADMVDAFGGAYTRPRTLEIMKDSRLGTFGTVALFLALGLKWASLTTMPDTMLLVGALLAGHTWSRAVSISLLATMQYAREDADAKSKPLATELGGWPLIVALACGIVPLLGFTWYAQQPFLLLALPVTLAARQFLAWRFHVRLGGYTGDCLGATQQICEGLCYLVFCAVLGR